MSCSSAPPPARVVTETDTIEVEVEVTKPLPAALVRAVPYPPGLTEGYTVEDVIDLTFALYDSLDQANADKAQAGQLTQPTSQAEIPQ